MARKKNYFRVNCDEIRFKADDFDSYAEDLDRVVGNIDNITARLKGGLQHEATMRELLEGPFAVTASEIKSAHSETSTTAYLLRRSARGSRRMADLCEENENAVISVLKELAPSGSAGSAAGAGLGIAGFADGYYASVAAAKKAEDEKKKKEQEEADAKAKADAEAAEKREKLLAFLAANFPETYAAYMQKLHEQEEAEWLESIKNDPEMAWMYDLLMDEKKRQEEARKAAEEAAAALGEAGEGDLFGGSAVLDDAGFGGGGSSYGGSDDFGGSFGGGGGGLSDFGTDDWASDLLADTVDTDELFGSQGALGEIAGATTDAATATGTEALTSGLQAALEEADVTLREQYNARLAELARTYGLQAAAVLGGAAALYATREQATEAVAYAAEFVQTRLKPAADDVLDQVRGAAKKARVNVVTAKSRTVAAVREEGLVV